MVVKRLYLVVLGVVCTVAGADAQSLSAQPKSARAHVNVATVAGSSSSNGSLGGVKFSDPYAPPVGTGKRAIARFPAMPTDGAVEPQGRVSFTAGRDSPDEPLTGGLKLSF
jgi:hypothetical protein